MRLIAPMLICAALQAADPGYQREVEQYRAAREASLKADDGWLTVVGLSWLHEGANSAGAGDSNDVALPASAPAKVGVFTLTDESVLFKPAAGVVVTLNGKPVSQTPMLTPRDVLEVSGIKFFVIKRGDKYGIRVKDNNSEYRRNFTGLKWFPIDTSWRITAKFVPYDQPRIIAFDSMNGVRQEMRSPGYVTFTHEGKEFRLDPVWEGDQFFFVIRDTTAGKLTYPAARFIYAEPPKNGTVVIDFNKAINPPCAFTPYATCPLPPPQNRLPIAVTAGEKKYSDVAH